MIRYDACSQKLTGSTWNQTENLNEQEVKVIWQKAPHGGGGIPRLGGRKLYYWIPGVGFPISVP